MSKNFLKFFETKKYSRGFDVKLNQITQDRSEEINNRDIQKVIKVIGIRADRAVSNDDRNHVLSSLTGKYFSSYKAAKMKVSWYLQSLKKNWRKLIKNYIRFTMEKKVKMENLLMVFLVML